MYSLSQLKKQLTSNNNGQGQVEYTILVVLVTLVFWLGIRDTNIGQSLQTAWQDISGAISPGGGGSGGGPGTGSGGGSGGSGGGSGGDSGGGSSAAGLTGTGASAAGVGAGTCGCCPVATSFWTSSGGRLP